MPSYEGAVMDSDQDVIRKAAELAGWEVDQRIVHSGERLFPSCVVLELSNGPTDLGEYSSQIDALVLQCWRKWCDQWDADDFNMMNGVELGHECERVSEALRTDSLQALRIMVEDMEGVKGE